MSRFEASARKCFYRKFLPEAIKPDRNSIGAHMSYYKHREQLRAGCWHFCIYYISSGWSSDPLSIICSANDLRQYRSSVCSRVIWLVSITVCNGRLVTYRHPHGYRATHLLTHPHTQTPRHTLQRSHCAKPYTDNDTQRYSWWLE